MILNYDNLYLIPENDISLVKSLLDIKNKYNNTQYNFDIYFQDYHDEYSPERTDPCPDYYGCYRLIKNNDFIGLEMTLEELDNAICILSDFIDLL